jgi:hypothetical protein
VKVFAQAEETLDGAGIMVGASRLIDPEPLVRKEFPQPGSFQVPNGTINALELDRIMFWHRGLSTKDFAVAHTNFRRAEAAATMLPYR